MAIEFNLNLCVHAHKENLPSLPKRRSLTPAVATAFKALAICFLNMPTIRAQKMQEVLIHSNAVSNITDNESSSNDDTPGYIIGLVFILAIGAAIYTWYDERRYQQIERNLQRQEPLIHNHV